MKPCHFASAILIACLAVLLTTACNRQEDFSVWTANPLEAHLGVESDMRDAKSLILSIAISNISEQPLDLRPVNNNKHLDFDEDPTFEPECFLEYSLSGDFRDLGLSISFRDAQGMAPGVTKIFSVPISLERVDIEGQLPNNKNHVTISAICRWGYYSSSFIRTNSVDVNIR